jgi:cell wall-associated NlpC family hydrolase
MILLLEFLPMRFLYCIFIVWLALAGGLARAEELAATEPPPPVLQTASGWSAAAQEVLLNALSLTGVPYKYGGKSPQTGFDCSGFVSYVFQQATNLVLPHGARAISQLGQAIPLEQLQPGDLVFFNTLKSAFSHVGIYLGEGRFIHAPSSGDSIRIVDMSDSYWAKRFNGARRLPVSARSPAEVSAE